MCGESDGDYIRFWFGGEEEWDTCDGTRIKRHSHSPKKLTPRTCDVCRNLPICAAFAARVCAESQGRLYVTSTKRVSAGRGALCVCEIFLEGVIRMCILIGRRMRYFEIYLCRGGLHPIGVRILHVCT